MRARAPTEKEKAEEERNQDLKKALPRRSQRGVDPVAAHCHGQPSIVQTELCRQS
jgi:hypothetical protein